MRYPGADWRPGPSKKQGYPGVTSRAGKGAVLHSMEGSLAAALGELDRPERQASWHFSNPRVGRLLQHYEVEAVAWHAGPVANKLYVGIEHEGIAGQPLTSDQVTNDVGLLKWLSGQEQWPGFARYQTLFEHNEFMATACPSGRIPWAEVIARLTQTPAHILTPQQSLRLNLAFAKELAGERGADRLVDCLRFVYLGRGWPWPPS